MKKNNIIIIVTIIIICIIALIIGIYAQFFYNGRSDDALMIDLSGASNKQREDTGILKENFENIFDNKLTSKYNSDTKKINKNKDIVYTDYFKDENSNNYNLKVNIPIINIESKVIEDINKEIKSFFQDKAENIFVDKYDVYNIYSVNYMVSINEDILSLAIMAKLKDGNKAQRSIIKTYNYNLVTNKIVSVDNIIEYKKVAKDEVNAAIKKDIMEVNKVQEQLNAIYGNMFIRDLSNKMYNVENVENYFLDKENNLYIIYAYGNAAYTNEIDIIIF